MQTSTLRMQNIIIILNLKALKVFVINITVFYIGMFPHICVLIFINLKVYIKISIIPLNKCSTLGPSQ